MEKKLTSILQIFGSSAKQTKAKQRVTVEEGNIPREFKNKIKA